MLNFSGNAGENEVWRRLGRGWEVSSAGWTFYGFPLSHSETQSVLGNAVRTSYFLFARQKHRGATSQTRRNPIAPLTYCRSPVILLGTFAHVERHSLNCRRERRRRWGIFEQGTKKTYSFGFAEYRAITFLCNVGLSAIQTRTLCHPLIAPDLEIRTH